MNRREGIRLAAYAAASAGITQLYKRANGSQLGLVCLITGCSSGFGRLTALQLARQGHIVWASMRDIDGRNRRASEELLDIARTEGLELRTIALDVRDEAEQEAALREIVSKSGRLDVLVNNAAVIVCTPADCLTDGVVSLQFATNVHGPAALSSRALEVMSERGQCHIITVSSTVGRLNFPGISLYCASKHALESHFETLARENRATGISFSIIQPGPYRTRINPNAVDILERITIPELRRQRPMLYQKRIGELRDLGDRFRGIPPFDPQEVADLIGRRVAEIRPEEGDGLRYPIGHGNEFPFVRQINQVHALAQAELT